MATASPDGDLSGRSPGPGRGGFRLRLAVLIASVFFVCGAALVWGQYLVVAREFDRQVDAVASSVSANLPEGQPKAPPSAPGGSPSADPSLGPGSVVVGPPSTSGSCATGPVPTGQPTGGPGAKVTCGPNGADAAGSSGGVGLARLLRHNVLSGSILWLVGLVAVFGGVSAALAWWLAGRMLRRISEVTTMARSVSQHDLSARLNLPGPSDEIKELGDTLDAMLGRLERSFTAQDRFIANASHELRTPIAAGRTALEAPLLQGRFTADTEPSVRRALEANGRSQAIIAALLDLARARGGPHRSDDTVSLHVVTQEVLAELSGAIAAKDLAVAQTLDEAGTHGDPTLLRQLVVNLVANAVQHTPEGGDIEIHTSSRDTGSRLEVANSGPRIAADEVGELVEPFHRGRASRLSSTDGHGLGLAIVSAIVESHDGHLQLVARPGGGLRVIVDLPAADHLA